MLRNILVGFVSTVFVIDYISLKFKLSGLENKLTKIEEKLAHRAEVCAING
jgi:hypothetical protein